MTTTTGTTTPAPSTEPSSVEGHRPSVALCLIGGPTVLIEIGGLRLLTDPTFDAPRHISNGDRTLTKTQPPAVPVDEIGAIDAVLLSHDQHADNLDHAGRALLAQVPLVLTTAEGAHRLGGTARAIEPWYHLTLPRPDGGTLRVTAAPAQHGPDGTNDVTSEVTGFLLSGTDAPTIYVSGDNTSLDVVHDVADRCGRVDIAVLFTGAARSDLVDGYLTLTSDDAAEAARILDAGVVVPVHAEGWAHFTEGIDDLTAAFDRHGASARLRVLTPGERTTF